MACRHSLEIHESEGEGSKPGWESKDKENKARGKQGARGLDEREKGTRGERTGIAGEIGKKILVAHPVASVVIRREW